MKTLLKFFFIAFFLAVSACKLVEQSDYSGRSAANAIYVVKERDTLPMIAKKLAVSEKDLAGINGLTPYNRVYKGQRLKVPGRNYFPSNVKQVAPAAYNEEISMTPEQSVPTPEVEVKGIDLPPVNSSPVVTENLSPPQPMVEERPIITPQVKKPHRPLKEQKFIWPAKGKVVEKFGPATGGVFNNGITISGREDQEVKAIADGEVIYIGSNVRGYGSLIILKHFGPFVSAYSMERNNNVSKGDFIDQGQAIGFLGSSSQHSTPELHFVLKKGKQLVDPVKYLKN